MGAPVRAFSSMEYTMTVFRLVVVFGKHEQLQASVTLDEHEDQNQHSCLVLFRRRT